MATIISQGLLSALLVSQGYSGAEAEPPHAPVIVVVDGGTTRVRSDFRSRLNTRGKTEHRSITETRTRVTT